MQAAHNWNNKFSAILTNPDGPNMKKCQSDQCVYVKHDKNGEIILVGGTHIDNNLHGGFEDEVENMKAAIKKEVNITETTSIKKFLGVEYRVKKDQDGYYVEMSMTKYLEDLFEDAEAVIGKTIPPFDTPGKPQEILLKHEGEPIKQSDYRRLVGKALYAVRKVIPDCSNVIRELTSHLTNPGEAHWEALQRLIGYLKVNKQPLQFRTPDELRVVAYSDSDWATDKNDRKSISAYLLTIGGSLVQWYCKKQTGVALSSTEAELSAASAAAQGIRFQNMLLEEMVGKELIKPSRLFVDNTGAMFIAGNGAVGSRTKHIEIKDRYVTQLTGSGELDVLYINTNDNPADAISKNCKIATHQKHATAMYHGRFPNTRREAVGAQAPDCVYPENNDKEDPEDTGNPWTTVERRSRDKGQKKTSSDPTKMSKCPTTYRKATDLRQKAKKAESGKEKSFSGEFPRFPNERFVAKERKIGGAHNSRGRFTGKVD